MESLQIFTDSIGLLIRWLHVVSAIAWVGASFYFIWVENVLIRGGKQRDNTIAGHLWAIHGGGFYYLEKYKSAPPSLPPVLHWFKWEAYTTWLSGMGLMLVIYYVNADIWLVATDSDVSAALAIFLSIMYLAAGFSLYAALCRTPLIAKPLLFGGICLFLIMLTAYFLPTVFSLRATFIHIGALLGTIMAGNVLFVIIPTQKKMVAAAETGNTLDAAMGRYAGLRSLHNNYLTLAVVFFMISGHYPALYSGTNTVIVTALVFLSSVAIRHYFNLRARGLPQPKWIFVGSVLALMIPLVSLPNIVAPAAATVSFTEVRAIIAKHCLPCHSANNTSAVFRSPPAGFTLDSDDKIRAAIAPIYQRVIVDRSMPFNNETAMNEEDRALIAAWIKADKEEK